MSAPDDLGRDRVGPGRDLELDPQLFLDDHVADLEDSLAIDRHRVVDNEEIARPETDQLPQLAQHVLGRTSAELGLANVAESARRRATA